jgi:hypothetical protein
MNGKPSVVYSSLNEKLGLIILFLFNLCFCVFNMET